MRISGFFLSVCFWIDLAGTMALRPGEKRLAFIPVYRTFGVVYDKKSPVCETRGKDADSGFTH
jgi:hypothetical protein